jgi:hypothetical protein
MFDYDPKETNAFRNFRFIEGAKDAFAAEKSQDKARHDARLEEIARELGSSNPNIVGQQVILRAKSPSPARAKSPSPARAKSPSHARSRTPSPGLGAQQMARNIFSIPVPLPTYPYQTHVPRQNYQGLAAQQEGINRFPTYPYQRHIPGQNYQGLAAQQAGINQFPTYPYQRHVPRQNYQGLAGTHMFPIYLYQPPVPTPVYQGVLPDNKTSLVEDLEGLDDDELVNLLSGGYKQRGSKERGKLYKTMNKRGRKSRKSRKFRKSRKSRKSRKRKARRARRTRKY